MRKTLTRLLLALLFVTAGSFLADWVLWRLRLASGTGIGKVVVSRMQVASLKGSKEEYYFLGTAEIDCSRSLFPHNGDAACWWLEDHKTVIER